MASSPLSVLTKRVLWSEDLPVRGQNLDVDLGWRREFTLQASQQQPTAPGRAGNIFLNTRKLGSTPANKPEGNVQGKRNPPLGFMAL